MRAAYIFVETTHSTCLQKIPHGTAFAGFQPRNSHHWSLQWYSPFM